MRKTIEKTINKGLKTAKKGIDTGKDVLTYPLQYPKKLTNLFIPTKQHTTPLKRSMSGYETENFILKNDGSLDHSGKIFKLAEKKGLAVKKEAAKSMVEVICMPHKRLSSTSIDLINNLLQLTELTEKNNGHIYPFSTYPGINKPVIQKNEWYKTQEKIFGYDKYMTAGLCCGFHQHYALPRGMFDPKTKFINYKLKSKIKKTLIDSYNLLNAVDPIFTTLLQSSPYDNCKYLAKDSRMLLYRGGKKLTYMKGKYAHHQLLGGLSPYKQTLQDLISTIKRRKTKWDSLLRKQGLDPKKHCKCGSELDFTWNPVKINAHGTLEYRGPDMNLLSILFGMSTMMKFALREIQQNFLIVVPMDIEMKEAFTVENNMVFIPPHTIVRNELQVASAYEGFKNKDLKIYINRFYNFVKSNVLERYRPLLKPIKQMIDNETSISDKIVAKTKRAGYKNKITQSYAKELSLFYSKQFIKDLEQCQTVLSKIGD